jgi:hypothetical protein
VNREVVTVCDGRIKWIAEGSKEDVFVEEVRSLMKENEVKCAYLSP